MWLETALHLLKDSLLVSSSQRGASLYLSATCLTFGTNSCPQFSAKSYIVRRRRAAAPRRCHKLLQEQCRGGKVDDVGGRLRLGVVVASLAVAAPRRGTARGTRRRISTTLKRVSLRRGRRNTPRRGVRYGGHQPQPHRERPLLQLRQHRLSEHPHYVRNFVRHVQQF